MQDSGDSCAGKTHLLVILGLVLLVRLPDLPYHYVNWDEGAMMAQAWAMTQGQLLYRDIFQIHPILNIALFCPFFALLKPDWVPHAVKLLNLLLAGAGGLLVYRIVCRWLGKEVPSLLAASIFVFYLGRGWALSSFGAFYAIFPILLSFYLLFVRRAPSRATYLLCGLLWGSTLFIKQVALFDVAALYLGLLYVHRKSASKALSASLYLFLGSLVPLACISAYFLSLGTFKEALQSSILRPLTGYAQLRVEGGGAPALMQGRYALLRDGLPKIGLEFAVPLVAMLCGMFGAVFESRRGAEGDGEESRQMVEGPWRRTLLGIIWLWLGAAFLGILFIGRFYPHYMLPLVPGVCLACVYWVAGLDRRSLLSLGAGILALLYAFAAYHFVRSFWDGGLRPLKVRRSRAIADYIAQHTSKDDRIFLWRYGGTDVFFLSGRLSNNGIYEYVDMCEDHIRDRSLVAAKREEFLRRLPRVIVVDPQGSPAGCEDSVDFFEKLLDEDYLRTTTVYGMDLYFLRDDRHAGLRGSPPVPQSGRKVLPERARSRTRGTGRNLGSLREARRSMRWTTSPSPRVSA